MLGEPAAKSVDATDPTLQVPVRSVPTIALLAVAILLAWPLHNGLLWGLVFSGIVYPFHRLMRSRMPDGLAAGLSVVVTFIGLAAPVALIYWFVSDQARTFSVHGVGGTDNSLDQILSRIQNFVDPWLGKFGLSIRIAETWKANENAWMSSLGAGVYRSAQSVGQLGIDMAFGVFAQFFILKDIVRLRAWGCSNSRLGSEVFDKLSRVAYQNVQAVFQGTVVVSGLQGFLIGLTFMIAGLPNWGSLAVLSGILCFLPYVGAPFVYVPVAVILFSQGRTWQGILVLVVGIGIVSQIDNLLRPYFIAGKAGLHPVVVFVSMFGGASLLGPVGLIIGPMMVAILEILWMQARVEVPISLVKSELPLESREPADMDGLSEAEAVIRLKTDGPNELPSARPRSPFAIALDVVREPMFLLLVACAVIYLILGDKEEALMIASAVGVVIGITFYQERKTERTLEALRDLSSPRALVIREGEQKRIAGREVVVGDLLVLAEGDRVPADCILISGLNIAADESMLTGESVAVRKLATTVDRDIDRPGGDDQPFVYSGTLIVQGHGTARVKSTGVQTEIGNIGKSLQSVEQEATLLQRSTKRLVNTFAIVGLSLCLVVILVYGLTRGSWLNGVLAGITMAISMIPEEFPVVLTIFLALGAWRIAQKNVLTRRVTAIETLGAATVLCVDKTGTLTQNQMSVSRLCVQGVSYEVLEGGMPEACEELAKFGILASQPDPFDPMEKAIHLLSSVTSSTVETFGHDLRLIRQYALSPDLLAMSQVWNTPGSPNQIVAVKGAPEAIAGLCKFDEQQKRALDMEVKELARQGLRVLGVAKQVLESETLPEDQRAFTFTYLGLIGLADPVRPTVASAVTECYSAGVRVVMITGDYPETAMSIARQIGLRSPDEVVTGQQLVQMNGEALSERIRSVNIFARVMPEQKLLLVNALKLNGEIVAMTGDGVNDAPALKAAHIGIAMGKRGTDVAREAADLVLLDDDFSSIVASIRLGRRIYTNIKDAMSYIMAIHVPIAGLSLLPVLFGWPLILMPVHIVFLELIIDPACSVVFESEPEDPDVMQLPPRDPNQPLFNWRGLSLSLLQGAGVLVAVLAVFGISLYRGQGELDARALTYTTLVVANLGLILTNLSWSRSMIQILKTPNRALWWVLGGVLASVAALLYIPILREMFRFSFLHPIDIGICLAAGLASVLWFELLKAIRGNRNRLKKEHRGGAKSSL